jgi:hypothetical protein
MREQSRRTSVCAFAAAALANRNGGQAEGRVGAGAKKI